MNHAERVKELAEQYFLWESTGDELYTAIDAMQSALDHALESEKEGWRYSKEVAEYLVRLKTALDDAVAKLAARDAEIKRLRKDVGRFEELKKGFSSASLDTNGNHCWVYRRNFSLSGPTLRAALDAALSEEVKGGGDDWKKV